MRLPRFFGKKLGERRSGSHTWGSLGEALFHAVLLVAGLVFAGLLVSGVAVPEWRINHDFLPTRCLVKGRGLVRRTVEDPPGSFTTTWRPALLVRYSTGGSVRTGAAGGHEGSGGREDEAEKEGGDSKEAGDGKEAENTKEAGDWEEPGHKQGAGDGAKDGPPDGVQDDAPEAHRPEAREYESWSRSRGGGTASREAAAAMLAAMPPLESEVPGWYDPADPATVVLERGFNWWTWLLTLLLPGALVSFGGAGLLEAIRRWGRSAEAIAAVASGSDRRGPAGRRVGDGLALPGIPSCDDLVNSPGTVLRYRLPIESAENWTLAGLGLFALLWNSVLAILAINAGLDLAGGRIDWLLLTLLVPFAGIGIAGVVAFVRELFLAAAVGTTQIEISDHPLEPGHRYDLLIAQAGTGLLHELEVALELEEQATFHQGTDTRTETLVVLRRPVCGWRGLELAPAARLEERAVVEIPAASMHSFASEHNIVRWRLVVRGKPARWPEFRRVFPLVVHPAGVVGGAGSQRETAEGAAP